MKQRLLKTEAYRLIALGGPNETIYWGVLYHTLDFYCEGSSKQDQVDAVGELIRDGYVKAKDGHYNIAVAI